MHLFVSIRHKTMLPNAMGISASHAQSAMQSSEGERKGGLDTGLSGRGGKYAVLRSQPRWHSQLVMWFVRVIGCVIISKE